MAAPLTAAVVGCGAIARAHLVALQRIAPGASEGASTIVCATVDRDRDRARALAAETPGATPYTDLGDMLAAEQPDVVHIVTPPDTHATLSIAAMEAGCHVLVEKPMALSSEEALRMVATADRHGVLLSTCHNYLFKPSVAKARRLVERGDIGRVVGVTAYYGVSGEGGYTPSSAGSHWAWRLPGGVFTNFLPHLIYLVEAFAGRIEEVAGVVGSGPPDDAAPTMELSVLARGELAPATLDVSLRTRPYAKFVEVRGEAGTIRADLVREVCTVQHDRELPGMVEKVAYNLSEITQLTAGTVNSAARVALGQWRSMPGLQALVRDLYGAVTAGGEPVVTGRDGLRMVEAMERVWARIPQPRTSGKPVAPEPPRTPAEVQAHQALAGQRVLVTGATGFLGSRLVAALARAGAAVTALVRDERAVPFQVEGNADLVVGTLDDSDVLEEAARGARVVYHCAAVTTNQAPWSQHHDVNVEGARRVLEAARHAGAGRVVHVSSVVVYGVSGEGVVDETAAYAAERDPWAHYLRSKLAADRLALDWARQHELPVAVLRLGLLYGPGRPVRAGLLRAGSLAVTFGRGDNHLPYTHVDNAIDALLLAGIVPEAPGEAFNVVDDPQVRVRDAVAMAHPGRRLVTVPAPAVLLRAGAALLERHQRRRGSDVPPRLSRFVVRSACRDLRYDTTKARKLLGWRPAVDPVQGLPAASGHAPR